MTFLRSQRSTSTPPTEARKNPGISRALMTMPIAASGDDPPTRAAIASTATRPVQSPSDDATWAIQSLKKDRDPRRLGPLIAGSRSSSTMSTGSVTVSSAPGGEGSGGAGSGSGGDDGGSGWTTPSGYEKGRGQEFFVGARLALGFAFAFGLARLVTAGFLAGP